MGAATIYALSSAHGKAGVSVVRVSGPAAFDSFRALTGRAEPGIRKAVFTPLKNPEDNTMIDHALVLCFENPHSFTGEKVVEYQLHGSPAVWNPFFPRFRNAKDIGRRSMANIRAVRLKTASWI